MIKANKSTALGSTSATNTSHRDDSEANPLQDPNLPRRLRDVTKDRVILIERGSALCDNFGLAYVDYATLKRGKYRLFFMRIENEQRIMYNSRLEVLGGSNLFSLNNIVQDEMERKSFSPIRETRGVLIKINGEHNSSIDARNIQDFDD